MNPLFRTPFFFALFGLFCALLFAVPRLWFPDFYMSVHLQWVLFGSSAFSCLMAYELNKICLAWGDE